MTCYLYLLTPPNGFHKIAADTFHNDNNVKTMFRKFGILVVLTLAVMGVPGASAGPVWDYAADFNAGANPNGAWTYGMNPAWAPGWTVYDLHDTNVGALINWGDYLLNANFGGAAVKNNSASPYALNDTIAVNAIPFSSYWEAGQAGLWGGWNGTDAIVRWTAPSAMTIDVSARFTGQNTTGTVEIAEVAKNGVSLWTGNINGFVGRAVNSFSDASGPSPVQVYSSTNVTVAQGDYMDFMITQGRYQADQVGLQLTITNVPEPSTWVLLAFSVTTVMVLRRRRTRA